MNMFNKWIESRVFPILSFGAEPGWFPAPSLWAVFGVWTLLAAGCALVFGVLAPLGKANAELKGRTFTWVILITLLSVALQSARGIIALFCLVSLIGISEFLKMNQTRRPNWYADAFMYFVCLVQYGTVLSGWYGLFFVLIPVHVFLFLPYWLSLTDKSFVRPQFDSFTADETVVEETIRISGTTGSSQEEDAPSTLRRRSPRKSTSPARFKPSRNSSPSRSKSPSRRRPTSASGQWLVAPKPPPSPSVAAATAVPAVEVGSPHRGFVSTVGLYHLCLMSTTFSLAHVAQLVNFPLPGPGGNVGLVLFILAITELNDVAQFCAGKLFGRHKAVPSISPKKTWEGVAGGVIACVTVAVLMGPSLTPIQSVGEAAAFGIFIAVAGFVGDLTMSGLKRDTGVKDTGKLLPGHGGLLDRVDSLAFSAPLFYHWCNYFHNPRSLNHQRILIWSPSDQPQSAGKQASIDSSVTHALTIIMLISAFGLVLSGVLVRVSRSSALATVSSRLFQRGWTTIRGVLLFVLLRSVSLTSQINLYAFFAFSLLKEYLSSIPTRPEDRSLLLAIFGMVPLQFLWIHMQWYGLSLIFVPLYVFLYIPLHLIVIGETKGFLRTSASIHWGIMISVFTVAHCAMVFSYTDRVLAYDGPSMMLFFSIVIGTVSLFLGGMLPQHASSRWACVGASIVGAVAAVAVQSLSPFGFYETLLVGAGLGHSSFAGEQVMQCLTAALGRSESGTSFSFGNPLANLFARQGALLYSIPLGFHYIYFMNSYRRVFFFG